MSTSEVDAFLAGVPQPQRATLQILRQRLRAHLPDAEEAISYGVPAFKLGGVAVAGYSAAAKHCSYYPMSGSVLERVRELLEGYSWSKGTLRFPIDEPLPDELVAALVEARRAEIVGGAKA